MPSLLQFGAGNIGRGFIAPTFAGAGWEVIFVEVAEPMLEILRAGTGYTVYEVDNDGERPVRVTRLRAVDGRDREAVADAVVDADLAATAVGLGALPHLGAPLAAGLTRRGRPLDILVCENGAQAPEILCRAITEAAADPAALPPVGYVRTSIGRMVPPPSGGSATLDIRVEPYAKLPVDAAAFTGPVPEVGGLVARDDFTLVLQQKLYLHNLTHACLAYTGHLRGYPDVAACTDDGELMEAVARAAEQVCLALAREHGGGDPRTEEAIAADSRGYLAELLPRYGNRALADPVARVARDPVRKLAGDDRLVGAARLCRRHGLRPLGLCRHILDACDYRCADDDPARAVWADLRPRGWRTVLREVAGLDDKEQLMSDMDLAARQRQMAAIIRDAGIHLRDAEVPEIEIAELGLGRFEEFGLGIFVYVNTERVCAKELAMLPGQICPEHRHPDVDGEPGKEETFRCRGGEVHLFLPGEAGAEDREFALGLLPEDKRDAVTVFRHVHLRPGEQCTLPPDTLHWFAAGDGPVVVSEFSTRSRDEADVFTDPEIQRVAD